MSFAVCFTDSWNVVVSALFTAEIKQILCTFYYCTRWVQKQDTCCFVVTLANSFTWWFLRKCARLSSGQSIHAPRVSCYTTLWKFTIQKCHLFWHHWQWTVALLQLIIYHNFGKYQPIVHILVPADLQGNLQCKLAKVFHLTCTVLLH